MSTLNFIAVAPLPVADLDPICAKKHFPNENSRIYVAIPEIVIPAAAKRRAEIHNLLVARVVEPLGQLGGLRTGHPLTIALGSCWLFLHKKYQPSISSAPQKSLSRAALRSKKQRSCSLILAVAGCSKSARPLWVTANTFTSIMIAHYIRISNKMLQCRCPLPSRVSG
jgi:hypothetical protein